MCRFISLVLSFFMMLLLGAVISEVGVQPFVDRASTVSGELAKAVHFSLAHSRCLYKDIVFVVGKVLKVETTRCDITYVCTLEDGEYHEALLWGKEMFRESGTTKCVVGEKKHPPRVWGV